MFAAAFTLTIQVNHRADQLLLAQLRHTYTVTINAHGDLSDNTPCVWRVDGKLRTCAVHRLTAHDIALICDGKELPRRWPAAPELKTP